MSPLGVMPERAAGGVGDRRPGGEGDHPVGAGGEGQDANPIAIGQRLDGEFGAGPGNVGLDHSPVDGGTAICSGRHPSTRTSR